MPAAPPTDAELLRAHGAGDPAAFAALYDRHDRPCFCFILRMLGRTHHALAEELHQDAWLVVATKWPSFDASRAGFTTWLFTIARNKVLDHFRAQTGAPQSSSGEDGDALDAVADEADGPLAQVASRELAAALVAAVESLPAPQRETFVLFAGAGCTLEEVCAITGVGLETAKSRLRYARAALKPLLHPWRPVDA